MLRGETSYRVDRTCHPASPFCPVMAVLYDLSLPVVSPDLQLDGIGALRSADCASELARRFAAGERHAHHFGRPATRGGASAA